MKKGYFVLIVIILFTATLFAGAYLLDFRGYSEGENGRIEWETREESNLKHFIIERKTPQTNWIEIATIQPKGSNSFYSFIDESIFKLNEYVFNYQLKIVDNNGNVSKSEQITLALSPSSVYKSTWGSIKAMFR
jgi:hypothetical protein